VEQRLRARNQLLIWLSAGLLLRLPTAAAAQDATVLARQTQNPISTLISVPFQGNWDSGIGDNDDTSTLLNFQPVIPFGVSRSTNVILRVIMPLTSQPGSDSSRSNGMGDVTASAFSRPRKPIASFGAWVPSCSCRLPPTTRWEPRSSASARRRSC
jgi:hypothetical protein